MLQVGPLPASARSLPDIVRPAIGTSEAGAGHSPFAAGSAGAPRGEIPPPEPFPPGPPGPDPDPGPGPEPEPEPEPEDAAGRPMP